MPLSLVSHEDTRGMESAMLRSSWRWRMTPTKPLLGASAFLTVILLKCFSRPSLLCETEDAQDQFLIVCNLHHRAQTGRLALLNGPRVGFETNLLRHSHPIRWLFAIGNPGWMDADHNQITRHSRSLPDNLIYRKARL